MAYMIRVDIVKLFKTKTFWIGLILHLLYLLWNLDGGVEVNKYISGGLISAIVPGTAFIIVSVIPFIVCADFDGGMVRNKIVSGHTRTQIYISNLIVSIISAVLIYAELVIAVLIKVNVALGRETVASWASPALNKWIFSVIALYLLVSIAFAALTCAVCMMTGKKVIALVVTMVLFLASFATYSIRFYATEDSESYYIVNHDEYELIENPYYISDDSIVKQGVKAIDSMNYALDVMIPPIFWSHPYMENDVELGWYGIYWGQWISDETKNTADVPDRYFEGHALSIILTTLVGVYVFNKRNLK